MFFENQEPKPNIDFQGGGEKEKPYIVDLPLSIAVATMKLVYPRQY